VEFETRPGTGVYFPSTSPHATRTQVDPSNAADSVSISIGVVFYTQHTRRIANVHVANHYLRRLGLTPRHPGESAWVDGLKHPLGRAIVWAQRRFRGYQPKPGLL
jgi:hypothetical protein